MLKSFLIILFISKLTFATDCNNPLLTTLGLPSYSGSPFAVSGISYCARLQDGTASSCCTADTINSIQTKQDSLYATINNLTISRDTYMKNNLKSYISKIYSAFYDFMYAYRDVAQSNITSQYTDTAANIAAMIAQIQQSVILSGTLMESYLNQRATCYTRMLNLQSAAYCLACDARYSSRGVASDGTVTISSSLCTKIQNDCYPYLNTSATMTNIIVGERYIYILKGWTKLFQDILNRVIAVPSDNSTLPNGYNTFTATNLYQANVALTDDCTNETDFSNCTWICNNFIINGKISNSNLVAGGKISDSTITTIARVLNEETAAPRILDTGGWEPDENEAGTTVTVVTDPIGFLSGFSLKPVFILMIAITILVGI